MKFGCLLTITLIMIRFLKRSEGWILLYSCWLTVTNWFQRRRDWKDRRWKLLSNIWCSD